MQTQTSSGLESRSGLAALAQRPVSILGVPASIGGRMGGSELGPQAIREAGLARALGHFEREPRDLGDVVALQAFVPDPSDSRCRHLPEVRAINETIAGRTLAQLREGNFALALGGDHTMSIGTIAAAGEYCKDRGLRLGVLWIDAHPDLNTPDTTPSGNIHGMVLGAAFGLWPSTLAEIGGSPDFQPHQLAYAGIRSIDPGEQAAIERLGIYAYSAQRIHELGIGELLRQLALGPLSGIDYLHVSLDLDSADPSVAPGVSTPEPNGLSEPEVAALLAWARQHDGFRSMDIAELNPARDEAGRTADFAVRMAQVALGG